MSFLKAPKSTFITFLTVFLMACAAEKRTFSKKDVKSSQRLVGVEFSRKKIDTLYDYLERNKKGYDSLHKYSLDYEVFPALLFDPMPKGYQVPKSNDTTLSWKEAGDVPRPENLDELAFYTIPKLASLIKNRKVTCLELAELYLDRLKNTALNWNVPLP